MLRELWIFLIVLNTLLTAYLKSHYATMNQLEQEKLVKAVTRNSHCSQPSGSVTSGRR